VSTPLAAELGAFVAGFDLEASAHRAELLERARWLLLDTAGLALVAWTAEDGFAARTASARAGHLGPCTVIGSPRPLGAPAAAFVNGTLAHGWDFDDFFLDTIMHCESFAVAAALAVAEEQQRSGAALLAAIVLACEVSVRLADGAAGEHGTYSAGFHNTSLFGAFGAAAAAAWLLGLDEREATNALALTASFASGTSAAWTLGTGRHKPAQVGWAAHAGISAAHLAATGYGCPDSTLDGPRGFYEAHTRGKAPRRAQALAALGDRWRTMDVGIKLLPCGTLPQPAAQLMEEMVATHGIAADEVLSVEVVLPDAYAPVLRDVGQSLWRPPTGAASIGSVPCILARVLLDGSFWLEHRTDAAVRDPVMLALADRIELSTAPPAPAADPAARPVTITVRTRRGTFEGRMERDRGHPGVLTRERVIGKFRRTAGAVLDTEAVTAVEDRVLRCDEAADARSVFGDLHLVAPHC